jgi:hypothetical protein
VEPCSECGDQQETRECFIDGIGPTTICQACAVKSNNSVFSSGVYDFSAWVPSECYDCGTLTAMKGPLAGYSDGGRCNDCHDWIWFSCYKGIHKDHNFQRFDPPALDVFIRRVSE